MAGKVGRPGQGRAEHGRIRAAVRPDLKEEADRIALGDGRIRSLSRLVESALQFYVFHYKQSGGELDRDGLPLIRPPLPASERAPLYQRKPASGS